MRASRLASKPARRGGTVVAVCAIPGDETVASASAREKRVVLLIGISFAVILGARISFASTDRRLYAADNWLCAVGSLATWLRSTEKDGWSADSHPAHNRADRDRDPFPERARGHVRGLRRSDKQSQSGVRIN